MSEALPLVAGLLVLLAACQGERGPAGPVGTGDGGGGTDPGPATPVEYALDEEVPRLVAHIEELGGASGPAGEFLIGDTVSVVFTLQKADGSPWRLDELGEGEALVSGPTFNYQRVLPLETGLAARALELTPGRYRFTFPDPIPEVYAPPYNDTGSFTANGGDLGGQPLLDGTYTLGLSFTWSYAYAGRPYRRVGEATADFLLGTGAGALAPRAVTTEAHCTRCHGELSAHDGRYHTLVLCLLCHTSGAEDANLPEVEGGTPEVTIDSRVLFHKLHTGRFLPSVNGMTTRRNGSRNYNAAPRPLLFARSDGSVRDFSHVGFPALPNRVAPLPRDTGYANLSPSQKAQEDNVRSGPAQCRVCHGDPDGDGPLEEPAQAGLSLIPSRRACGACHDDVDFTGMYDSNGRSMRAQQNDNLCTECHDARVQDALSPVVGHLHPLENPVRNPGLEVELHALVEEQGDGDGSLDPGERARLSFSLHDGAGGVLAPDGLDELRLVLSGPTTSFQVLYDRALPLALVPPGAPHELVVPERVELERVGVSGPQLDTFETARFPHRLASGVATRVFVRAGAAGGDSLLALAARRHDTAVELVDASAFAPGDVVAIDDGASGEEYLRVLLVDGGRLLFSPPNRGDGSGGLRAAHAAGARVRTVQLFEAQAGVHFTLDPASGTLAETVELGDGRVVLVSYTTDWLVPEEYPQAPNGSPDLGDREGKWTGAPLVPGTYVATLVAARDFEVRVGGTSTPYRAASPGARFSFLVGGALAPEPYTRIPDGAACDRCHQELAYHDGLFRGFDTCIACHGASGVEDLPRSEAPEAPETRGRSVDFRALVHRIHRGRELSDTSWLVVGEAALGSADAFRTRGDIDHSTLPAFPGRTLECTRCHGEGPPPLPAERRHPSAQVHPPQLWRPVCTGCHDAESERAHVDSNTAPDGAEACLVCHATGEFEDASRAHLARLQPR